MKAFLLYRDLEVILKTFYNGGNWQVIVNWQVFMKVLVLYWHFIMKALLSY